ncbi:MAG: hypothetical protein ABR961_10750 [Thermoanaerobaculaceae bacterium]|jgi:hypothetical protein
MPAKSYVEVRITMQNGKLICTPDWIQLYWQVGPTDIRWAFVGIPKNAVSAVVEFLPAVPAKYKPRTGTFRPRGVHQGFGHAPASAGSHLPDVVTSGNTQESGYFYYDIKVLDGNQKVIAQTDPGGGNDPDPDHS